MIERIKKDIPLFEEFDVFMEAKKKKRKPRVITVRSDNRAHNFEDDIVPVEDINIDDLGDDFDDIDIDTTDYSAFNDISDEFDDIDDNINNDTSPTELDGDTPPPTSNTDDNNLTPPEDTPSDVPPTTGDDNTANATTNDDSNSTTDSPPPTDGGNDISDVGAGDNIDTDSPPPTTANDTNNPDTTSDTEGQDNPPEENNAPPTTDTPTTTTDGANDTNTDSTGTSDTPPTTDTGDANLDDDGTGMGDDDFSADVDSTDNGNGLDTPSSDTESDPTTQNGSGDPNQVTKDDMKKFELYKRYITVHNTIAKFIDSLENIIPDDYAIATSMKVAIRKLYSLQELTKDYMLLKFKVDSYLQNAFFFEKIKATMLLILEMIDNNMLKSKQKHKKKSK